MFGFLDILPDFSINSVIRNTWPQVVSGSVSPWPWCNRDLSSDLTSLVMTSVMNASGKLRINPLIASLFQVLESLFEFLLINPFSKNPSLTRFSRVSNSINLRSCYCFLLSCRLCLGSSVGSILVTGIGSWFPHNSINDPLSGVGVGLNH